MQSRSDSNAAGAERRRSTRATLWAGFFTNGVWDMVSVLVPLYGAAQGLSAAQVGFVVSARSVLPAILSIHGGILMDHWGPRRMLQWLSAGCIVLPLLYGALGWFAALVLLQLAFGLAASLSMAAAQTWSLQTSSDTATLAHFSLVSRIGTFLGPITIGFIWDHLGVWAAFVCVSIWAAGIIVTAAGTRDVAYARPAQPPQPGLRALVPQWHAHRRALALATIPAVAFILAASFLRNAPGAIQSSLYVLFLGEQGYSATVIGALVGICEFFGVAGSALAAPLERLIRPHMLVVLCIGASILAIALTPLVSFSLMLLVATAGLRGSAQGLSQPLMYSLLGRSVPISAQGASVGLRIAVTRLASIVTPSITGIAAEVWGVKASFYVAGVVLLTGAAGLGIAARVLEKR